MKEAVFIFSFLLPHVAFAARGEQTVGDLIYKFLDLVNPLILLIMGLALIFFFWGLVKFILRAGDQKGKEEGKQVMLWGIAALFVMVSIWGIVELFQYTFFGERPPAPLNVR